MRHTPLKTMMTVMVCALALGACSKAEVKTGSLTQRFAMMDAAGVNFGVVELDPINGGSVMDAQGRVIGRIVAPGVAQPTAAVAALNVPQLGPLPVAPQQ